MAILLHFFIEAKDAKAAKAVVDKVRDAVREIETRSRFKSSALKPYWKISGWYDAALQIVVPRGKDELQMERALAADLAQGWRWLPGGESAVCTDDEGRGNFKIAHMRWAEIAVR